VLDEDSEQVIIGVMILQYIFYLKVTLFGQSAGAESIGVHLTSNISKHLFQQAIMESNPFGLPFRTIDDAKKYGDLFAEAAKCTPNDMICLRSK